MKQIKTQYQSLNYNNYITYIKTTNNQNYEEITINNKKQQLIFFQTIIFIFNLIILINYITINTCNINLIKIINQHTVITDKTIYKP